MTIKLQKKSKHNTSEKDDNKTKQETNKEEKAREGGETMIDIIEGKGRIRLREKNEKRKQQEKKNYKKEKEQRKGNHNR